MQKPGRTAGWLRHVRLLIGLQIVVFVAFWGCTSSAQTLIEIRPITAGNASGQLVSPRYMVDGDPSTAWNSGGPPTQWIDIDVQRDRQVKRIQLLTSQWPNGPTTHNIYGRTQAGQWIGLGTLYGYTTDNQWLTLDVPPSIPIRYIIVQTTGGPSWVAWREIKVFEGLHPRERGDVVARDLASDFVNSFGHVGFWDGKKVYEVLNEATVVQANSYENFSARTKTWDPINTKIPNFNVSTCFSSTCLSETNWVDRVTLPSRQAMAARAEQIRVLRARYTVNLQETRPALPEMSDRGGRPFRRAVAGVYRCDTYVLDIFGFTSAPYGPYSSIGFMGSEYPIERVITGNPPSWATNLVNLHRGTILPLAIYEKLKAFTQ